MSGEKDHPVELVISASSLTIYLIDDGKVSSAKGASARAIVQDGSSNKTIALTADGDKLVGKIEAPLNKGARVVISGKDGHGHNLQGRFVVP